jgi:hypothetical protein
MRLAQTVSNRLRHRMGSFKFRPGSLGLPYGRIDFRLVPEIEGDGTVYLLESEGRERLPNAFGGHPVTKLVDNRTQRDSSPPDVRAAVPLLNVALCHTRL